MFLNLLDLLKLASPQLFTLPCLTFPTETPIKSMSYAFPSLMLLPPDKPTASLCSFAWYGVSLSLWSYQQYIPSLILSNLGGHSVTWAQVTLLPHTPSDLLVNLLTLPQLNQALFLLRFFVLLFHLSGILFYHLSTWFNTSSPLGFVQMSSYQQGLHWVPFKDSTFPSPHPKPKLTLLSLILFVFP